MNKTILLRYATLVLVLLCSFFLFWQVNSDKNRNNPRTVDPSHHDSYVQGAHYKSTDAKGNLHEHLRANAAKHYPHQNRVELTQPELDVFGPNGESWHIIATKGSSTQGTDTVLLYDKVIIEHKPSKNAATIVVSTDKLIVHPQARTADTQALVTITTPQIVLKGQGLHGDMKTGTLKLLTQIRGKYEPLSKPSQSIPVAHNPNKFRASI